MNRNTFFTALIALLAAPFTWAAGKVRADQLAPGDEPGAFAILGAIRRSRR